jgi:L-histidine Nalpha-methyltransferase
MKPGARRDTARLRAVHGAAAGPVRGLSQATAAGVTGDRDRREILRGLRETPRRLPHRLFYDAAGSVLFERIARLDEYYLTRVELAILRRHAASIGTQLGPRCRVVEPGSGSGVKSRLLLAALRSPAQYVPIDVATPQLEDLAARLRAEFPGLDVWPLPGDYERDLTLPAAPPGTARTVVFFPGSTIGNLEPAAARAFLRRLGTLCGRGGGVLVGVDVPKDPAVLEAAYNDAAGVTAAFNRNILRHVNRVLGSGFDPGAFEHRAVWRPEESRVEMSLVSRRRQKVNLGRGGELELAAGEAIVTEHCYKYDLPSFEALAHEAELRPARIWTDEESMFALHWLEVAQ